MDTPRFSSNLEARIAFKRLTGIEIRLTPFEVVVEIIEKSADEIVVKLIVFEVDERRTETWLNNRGTRLTQFKLVNGSWKQSPQSFTLWDTDFEPTAHNHYGVGKSVGEWLHARAYARLCYRPGSTAQPMDSFYRTTKGHTSSRMAKHW